MKDETDDIALWEVLRRVGALSLDDVADAAGKRGGVRHDPCGDTACQ